MILRGIDGKMYKIADKVHNRIVRRARSAMIPYSVALQQLAGRLPRNFAVEIAE